MKPPHKSGALAVVVLLATVGVVWPRSADAQFRYLVSADVHEKYDSNVFAGIPGAAVAQPWDMITEVEPGVRFYYAQRAQLLWLSYHFIFQAFARTADPGTDHKLLGYANRLNLEYTRLLSQTTGLRFFTRFAQGTENIQVPGAITPEGGIDAGYLTTGAKFLADDSRLELQHLWSQRLSSRLQLHGNTYQAFGRSTQETLTLLVPPDSWSIAPMHRLDYALQHDLFSQDTAFTSLLESRSYYPHDLATFFVDLTGGWRHFFSDFWDAHIGGGVDFRIREQLDPVSRNTWFTNDIGPLGNAGVRYRRRRELMVALEYEHIYALTLELGVATTADTDQVMLVALWAPHRDWLLEASGGFRYLRMALRVPDAPTANAKIATARASIIYVIRPGVSLDLTYDMEIVRDRPVADISQPGAQSPLPASYDRHIVGLGVSLAWPPVPQQDTQLARRASLNEPIFSLGPLGTGAAQLPHADDDLVRDRNQRAREQERAREQRQQQRDSESGPLELFHYEQPNP